MTWCDFHILLGCTNEPRRSPKARCPGRGVEWAARECCRSLWFLSLRCTSSLLSLSLLYNSLFYTMFFSSLRARRLPWMSFCLLSPPLLRVVYSLRGYFLPHSSLQHIVLESWYVHEPPPSLHRRTSSCRDKQWGSLAYGSSSGWSSILKCLGETPDTHGEVHGWCMARKGMMGIRTNRKVTISRETERKRERVEMDEETETSRADKSDREKRD